jgi:hypothetical protein
MKNLIKRLFGIDALVKEKDEALSNLAVARASEERAKEDERLARMTPKERATVRGEPYVTVLETHVNKENIRNGFFELDWNPEFVVQLKQAGYGYDGDPDEEIVDRWFRDLARNMLADEGVDTTRNNTMGFINVSKLGGGKSAVE